MGNYMIKKTILIAFILTMSIGLHTFSQNESDQLVFEQVCSRCHSLDRIRNHKKTTTGWKKTVDWMRRKPDSTISRKEAAAAKRYIVTINPGYAKELFTQKCFRCHQLDNLGESQRTPEQWRRLVQWEAKRASVFIALDEAKDIGDYLAATYGAQTHPLEPEKEALQRLTEDKCLRCHVPETVFKTNNFFAQWLIINKRMQQKSPAWIDDAQVETISQYLSAPQLFEMSRQRSP